MDVDTHAPSAVPSGTTAAPSHALVDAATLATSPFGTTAAPSRELMDVDTAVPVKFPPVVTAAPSHAPIAPPKAAASGTAVVTTAVGVELVNISDEETEEPSAKRLADAANMGSAAKRHKLNFDGAYLMFVCCAEQHCMHARTALNSTTCML
jgi:hypothetical protein